MNAHLSTLFALLFGAQAALAQIITLDPPLREGWAKAVDGPLKDAKGELGKIIAWRNTNRTKTFMVSVSSQTKDEIAKGFDQSVGDWKRGVLESIRDQKITAEGVRFRTVEEGGRKTAHLDFKVKGQAKTVYFNNQAWISSGKLIACQAIGLGIDAGTDPELLQLFKRVRVK